MKPGIHKTAQLGELVVAAFDKAARQSKDPREVSRLATQELEEMFRRARTTSISASPTSTSARVSSHEDLRRLGQPRLRRRAHVL